MKKLCTALCFAVLLLCLSACSVLYDAAGDWEYSSGPAPDILIDEDDWPPPEPDIPGFDDGLPPPPEPGDGNGEEPYASTFVDGMPPKARELWPVDRGWMDAGGGVMQQFGWYLPSTAGDHYYLLAVDLAASGAPPAEGFSQGGITFNGSQYNFYPSATFSTEQEVPLDGFEPMGDYRGFALYRSVVENGETAPWQEAPVGDKITWHMLLPLKEENLYISFDRAHLVHGYTETQAVYSLLDSFQLFTAEMEDIRQETWKLNLLQVPQIQDPRDRGDGDAGGRTANFSVLPGDVLHFGPSLFFDLKGWNHVSQMRYVGTRMNLAYQGYPLQVTIFDVGFNNEERDIVDELYWRNADQYTEVEINGVSLWKRKADDEQGIPASYLYLEHPYTVQFASPSEAPADAEYGLEALIGLLVSEWPPF